MRADRLVAAMLILQARGRVTAAELAAQLEVSTKTARRDLEALALAGIPVYAQPGRGGGWSLLGGARTDLSGLTAAEAQALFLVAGPSVEASAEAKAALRKLLRALPEPFRAGATAAASAVVLDPAGWGAAPAPAAAHLDELQRAVIEGRQVRFVYSPRAGSRAERRVHPQGLARKASAWYLLGDTDRGVRTFRLDRMEQLEVTDEPARRPADFELSHAWRSAVLATEQKRRRVQALVRSSAEVLRWLREQFGDALSDVRAIEGGRFAMKIAGPNAEWLADHLCGWGSDVEVVAPPQVRAAMARIGAELVARYGSD
jgi:predicted DNA-binding transcriptional regulator YafY